MTTRAFLTQTEIDSFQKLEKNPRKREEEEERRWKYADNNQFLFHHNYCHYLPAPRQQRMRREKGRRNYGPNEQETKTTRKARVVE
jgi:hypothetical protein